MPYGWRHNPETQEVFYNDTPLKIPPGIEGKITPVLNALGRIKPDINRDERVALAATLKDTLPNSIVRLALSELGLSSSHIIHAGVWAFDYIDDILFYESREFQAQPYSRALLKELITSFPFPVLAANISQKIYSGPAERALKNLQSNIRAFEHLFRQRFKNALSPVYYSRPLQAYTLDMNFEDFPIESREQMGILTFGPLAVSTVQKRIWLDKKPIDNIGEVSWSFIHKLMLQPGTIASKEDMEESIYGEEKIGRNILSGTASALRKRFNAVATGTGSMIQAVGSGYTLRPPQP